MVSSISPTPRKRALVDGKKWTNQSYVTIWMFVYFSKHGQIYVCNNLEGFACRPIYFRKQSFNKRKFPALEWEMQNHLANVNFPGYWVWSHNDHCDDAKAVDFDDVMIIYLNIGDGSDHDREDFHMFQIFLPSDMFLQMLLHPGHMCYLSQVNELYCSWGWRWWWWLLWWGRIKQAASDFNFGHFLWAWVSQRLACGPRPWRDGGAPATLFPNWHQVASLCLFAFPDLLCCWTEVDIVNVGVEPGHDIIINYYHLRQELFMLYTRTIISVTILAPNNPGPLTQCM